MFPQALVQRKASLCAPSSTPNPQTSNCTVMLICSCCVWLGWQGLDLFTPSSSASWTRYHFSKQHNHFLNLVLEGFLLAVSLRYLVSNLFFSIPSRFQLKPSSLNLWTSSPSPCPQPYLQPWQLVLCMRRGVWSESASFASVLRESTCVVNLTWFALTRYCNPQLWVHKNVFLLLRNSRNTIYKVEFQGVYSSSIISQNYAWLGLNKILTQTAWKLVMKHPNPLPDLEQALVWLNFMVFTTVKTIK